MQAGGKATRGFPIKKTKPQKENERKRAHIRPPSWPRGLKFQAGQRNENMFTCNSRESERKVGSDGQPVAGEGDGERLNRRCYYRRYM